MISKGHQGGQLFYEAGHPKRTISRKDTVAGSWSKSKKYIFFFAFSYVVKILRFELFEKVNNKYWLILRLRLNSNPTRFTSVWDAFWTQFWPSRTTFWSRPQSVLKKKHKYRKGFQWEGGSLSLEKSYFEREALQEPRHLQERRGQGRWRAKKKGHRSYLWKHN